MLLRTQITKRLVSGNDEIDEGYLFWLTAQGSLQTEGTKEGMLKMDGCLRDFSRILLKHYDSLGWWQTDGALMMGFGEPMSIASVYLDSSVDARVTIYNLHIIKFWSHILVVDMYFFFLKVLSWTVCLCVVRKCGSNSPIILRL